MDETKLVERAVSGAQAFGDLAKFHRPALLRVAIRILGDTPEAEDAVQEALIDALLSLATWERRGTFKAWLTGLVRNRCKRVIKERKAVDLCSLDAAINLAGGDPLDAIIAEETANEARAAVARLPQAQREAFEMHAEGKSAREIACVMGITEKAATRKIQRARDKLRGQFNTPFVPCK